VNLLLDTHVPIWWLEKSPRLGKQIRATLRAPDVSPWMSAVSIREISIKSPLGRLDLLDPPELWVPKAIRAWGLRALSITPAHAMAVRKLPFHHRDPFDRMLVAQAQCEGLTLVTADPQIMAYDIGALDASR
jgi:PIN domain nuclease of toxin-antitoxin system